MTEPALELLRELVELESPSGSAGARAVASRVALELERLGADTTLLEGNHLRAELPGHGDPLLRSGHVDTVWPEGTLGEMPFRVDGDRAYGPGVYDMKACLVSMLEAIRRAGPERRALRVVLTADEEQGSPTGRVPLEAAAQGVAAGIDVRIVHPEDREWVERALAELRPVDPEAELELGGGWTRPPLEPSEATGKLFARACEHGRELGLDLAEASSGGGSDGNLIGAL